MGSAADRTLIAYFSHSGNTRRLAEQIQQVLGGDLFEIRTVAQYPRSYQAAVDQAGRELKSNHRPELAAEVADPDSYGTVFIGYPNWWGTMPMAVFTFLEKHNLAGKTLVPFCTHEGTGLGRSVADITSLCRQSTMLNGLAVRGSSVRMASQEVRAWLRRLGMVDG